MVEELGDGCFAGDEIRCAAIGGGLRCPDPPIHDSREGAIERRGDFLQAEGLHAGTGAFPDWVLTFRR